jgi:Uma2 family endonuclease
MSTAELMTDPAPVVWTDAEFDRMVSLGLLPANHSRQGVRFTRDQYFTLAEHGFFDGRRVMLIHGEVLEMAAMKEPHASSVSGVADAFRTVFGAGFYVREEKPLDVGATTEPEPDVAVVPGSRKSYPQTPTAAVALVVVEVADTTLFYDTTTKAELYATAGIADYWVLDVVNSVLHVFRVPYSLPGGTKTFRVHRTLTAADTVSLLAVPNVIIPVADLLP